MASTELLVELPGNKGEVKTYRFIRSDILPSASDANDFMLKKAQMFIDQMGDDMF